MKYLIINSDDYGRSANVSLGIRKAHLEGVVSSTTCMMNLPTTAEDIGIALRETPDLGLGVHLVLTAGSPLLPPSEVSSLVDENGRFHRLDALTARLDRLDPSEAKAEWKTQIEAFVKTAGRTPTHLDSHHHSSYFTEGFFKAMLELAEEYGCAVRLPKAFGDSDNWAGLPPSVIGPIREYGPRLLKQFRTPVPDAFYASFYDETATKAEIFRILDALPEAGVFEIMCHPGISDPELIAGTSYAVQRDLELEVLTDPALQSALEEKNIQLVTFAVLSSG